MTARASRWARSCTLASLGVASLGLSALGISALGLGVSGTLLQAQTPPAAATAPTQPAEPPLQWHDVSQWGVEGRAWPDLERKRWYDRFPSQAEATVTPAVWSLSRNSAGMLVRFKTNADAIWANYTLFSDRISQANMTAIGVSLVVESGEHLLAIEVKARTRPRLSDAANLRVFLSEYADRKPVAMLLHTGETTEWLAPNVLAVPWWRIL